MPPPDKKYIQNAYAALKDNLAGFNKTPEQFEQLVYSDSAYRGKVYSALKDNLAGFGKSQDEFNLAIGIPAPQPSKPQDVVIDNRPSIMSTLSKPADEPLTRGDIAGMRGVPKPKEFKTDTEANRRIAETQKTRDVAVYNTVKRRFENTGRKFDEKSPVFKNEINKLKQKEINGEVAVVKNRVTGSPEITRAAGFGETFLNTIGHSVKSSVEAPKINSISNPNEFADFMDEKAKAELEIPESAPSRVGGFFGETFGGAVKPIGLLSLNAITAGIGTGVMSADAYQTSIAAHREQLYHKGLQENLEKGMSRDEARIKAASDAMKTANIEALPDAAVALALSGAGKSVKAATAQRTFAKALTVAGKDVAKMGGIGAASGAAKAGIEALNGYKVTGQEAFERSLTEGKDLALMDLAFKIGQIPNIPSYLKASRNEYISRLPKEIVEEKAAEMGEAGQQMIQEVTDYAKAREKVEGLVPDEHLPQFAGLAQKQDGIDLQIQHLEASKQGMHSTLHGLIDEQIDALKDERKSIDKQMETMLKSNDPMEHEVDNITGEKVDTKPAVIMPDEINRPEEITIGPKEIPVDEKQGAAILLPQNNNEPNIVELNGKPTETIAEPILTNEVKPQEQANTGDVLPSIDETGQGITESTSPILNETTTKNTSPNQQGKQPTIQEVAPIEIVNKKGEGAEGGEPPKGKVIIDKAEEDGAAGITHAANEVRRREQGLGEHEKTEEAFEQWQSEAEQELKNGYDVDGLLSKIENDETAVFSPKENAIRKIYVATLDAEIAKNPTDALLAKSHRAIVLGDISNSRAGKALVSIKGNGSPLETISEFYSAAKEALKTETLTPEQKKAVQKNFDDYDATRKADAEKMAALEAELAAMKAEKALAQEKINKKSTTKADYSKQKKEILESIKDKWKNAANDGTLTAVPVPYSKQLVAIAPDVAKLMKVIVSEGVETLAEVVKNIHDIVKSAVPEITEKDVRDIIAGEYNHKKETRNELYEKLYNLKEEQRLLNQLEALEAGVASSSNSSSSKVNKRITELRNKIRELKNDKTLFVDKDEQRLRNMISTAKSATEKIQQRIKDKDFAKEKDPPILFNKELQQRVPKLFEEAINARMAKDHARLDLDRALHEYEQSNRKVLEVVYDAAADVIGTTKALVTTFDLSGTFIQNAVYMFSHPIRGSYAFGVAWQHAFSKNATKKFNQWLTALHNSGPLWDLIQKSELDVTEPQSLAAKNHEEGFDRNLLNRKIKIKDKEIDLRKYNISAPFERHFTSLGNVIRVREFMIKTRKYYKEGKTFENNPKLFKDLATLLNTQTGRGQLPQWMAANSKIITMGIWSPRLMASRLNLLGLGDIANPIFAKKKGFYANLHPEIRKKAAMEFSKFVAGVLSVYAVGALMGGEPDLDPLSVTFGDLKVGPHKSYNLFGGFAPYVKLVAQMIMGERNLGGKMDDISDAKGKTRLDVGMKFVRGKTTPMLGVGIDLLARQDFIGKPITATDEILKLVSPLSLRDIVTNFKRDGVTDVIRDGLISTVGVNVKDDREYEKKQPAKKQRKPRKPRTANSN